MKYQDCIEHLQAPDRSAGSGVCRRLTDANINPTTGLATDYLNHFNEAIMLLDMISSAPDCLADFLEWHPLSYREHFANSRFHGRELAIAAYEAADPDLRGRLDALADTMTAVLKAAGNVLRFEVMPDEAGRVAERAAAWLKPMVARAAAMINGEAGAPPAGIQATVDGLMKSSA